MGVVSRRIKKRRERETKEKLPGWINVASAIRIAPLPSIDVHEPNMFTSNSTLAPEKTISMLFVNFTCSHSLTLIWIAPCVRNVYALPARPPLSWSRAAVRDKDRVYTYSCQLLSCLARSPITGHRRIVAYYARVNLEKSGRNSFPKAASQPISQVSPLESWQGILLLAARG